MLIYLCFVDTCNKYDAHTRTVNILVKMVGMTSHLIGQVYARISF